MKASLLLAAAALLALSGAASAGGDPDLVSILYENMTSLEACVNGTVHGGVGVHVDGTDITLDEPTITPPSPDCVVLP
jgi:hypothetical protein